MTYIDPVLNAFNAALQSNALGGDGGVTTDGRSIVIDNADLNVPENQYFTCSGPPGGSRQQVGTGLKYYWTLPNSIVLNPAFTVTRERQSKLSSCIIRPTWYVSTTTTDLTIPPTNVMQTVQMMHQFAGTATSCQGKDCPMEDMFIIGFDTCEDNDKSLKSVLSNLSEECLLDEWIHDNGGGMKLQNFTARPYIEGSLDSTVKRMTWDVSNVQLTGTDSVKVTINGSGITSTALSTGGYDTVLIDGLGQGGAVAPVSANGRWLTASVTDNGSTADVVLIGASWVGPSDSSSSWKAGTSVITVMDTTNIIPGQYVCASGTPPFCTTPSSFSAAFITTSDIHSLMTNGTGNVHLLTGQLTGWPVSGIVQVTSEEMAYTIVDAGTVAITQRGVNGTTKVTHVNTEHVLPAAPRVVGTIPTSEAVIVSAVAQTTCASSCGNVTFANDTRVVSGTLGQLTLNPGYHTWTANMAVGGNPSGNVVAIGNASSGSSSISITKNCWKVQRGMTVQDLTSSHVSDGTTVSSVDCGTGAIGIDPATTGMISNGKILFSGCGYPVGEPWKGNCASTTLLLGGTTNEPPPDADDEEAQGPTCEYVHSFGNEIQVHVINAPTTDCVNFVIAGGGQVGDQLDPDSVGLWFEGNATKSQFTNGRIAGAVVSILDTPAPQSSGIGISNVEIPGHVIAGPNSDLVLDGAHGNAPSGDFIFVSGTAASLQASAMSLPAWAMYFEDPLILPKLYCAANDFATPTCSQVKTAPICGIGGSGCTSVSGNDSDFDVTTTGTATSVTVMLAANYPAKPVCRASASTTTSGAAASASVSSVTFQPYGIIVIFKTSAAVPHIYGSCHSATG